MHVETIVLLHVRFFASSTHHTHTVYSNTFLHDLLTDLCFFSSSSSELELEVLFLCFFSFLLSLSPFFSFLSFFLFFFLSFFSRFWRNCERINRCCTIFFFLKLPPQHPPPGTVNIFLTATVSCWWKLGNTISISDMSCTNLTKSVKQTSQN